MLSTIKVACPHCGGHGQVTIPPGLSLLIGPCPECGEVVGVFCGQPVALDKETIVNASREDRREHILAALAHLLGTWLDSGLDSGLDNEDNDHMDGEFAAAGTVAEDAALPRNRATPKIDHPITEDEFEEFIHTDLRLLDNPEYFRLVFR